MDIQVTSSPIFVIGSPRSGTSMMQWALRQHPRLWGGPESDFLVPLVAAMKDVHAYGSRRGHLHWLSRQEVGVDEFIRHIGHGINALYTSRSGGLRWVEQTPLYTLILTDLASMFPDSRFLWMLRDGRQVVHSLQHFEANRQDLPTGAETWRRYTAAALELRESDQGHRVFTVPFHDVATDPEPVLEAVCTFLDIEPHPPAAAMIRQRKLNSSFSGDEAGDRIREGWRDWTQADRRTFERIAGPMMDTLFPGWDGARA